MIRRTNAREMMSKPDSVPKQTQWKMPRYKRDWKAVCAMIPKYLSDGANGTVIYYIDGTTEEYPNRLQWVLDDWLGYWGSSTQLLRKKSAEYLGCKTVKRVPLVVDKACCLLPVKARDSFSKNHGNMGYVVMEYVYSAEETDGKTTVQLAGGQSIILLEHVRTLRKNRRLGMALKSFGETTAT